MDIFLLFGGKQRFFLESCFQPGIRKSAKIAALGKNDSAKIAALGKKVLLSSNSCKCHISVILIK